MNQVSQNQSMQVAAKDRSTKTTHGFISPKDQKASLKTQQQLNMQANMNLSAFDTGKYKKQSMQSARLTAEKYIKKRTADFSIFSKPNALAPSSQFTIPTTTKVGEVFSSIAKSGSNRASPHLKMVQILKANSTHPGKSNGKKKEIPNSKQIFSSMGFHHHVAANQISMSHQVSKPQPTTTGKATVLNGNRVQTIPQIDKYLIGKNGRQSESRLENLEGNPSVAFGKKIAHNIPMQKSKKRMKEHLVSNSLLSLQESFFNQNLQKEVHTAANRLSRGNAAPSRSKSKSPTKKLVGYLERLKTRPVQKKQLALLVKKTVSYLGTEEKDVDSSEKQLEKKFESLRNSKLQKKKGRKQIRKFKTATTQSKNLNMQHVTADDKYSEGQVLTNQSAQHLSSSNDGVNDTNKEDSQSGSNESDEGSEDSAVPDEIIDYEAAGDVFRELSKLVTFQMRSGQTQNTPSQLSHRSHDNIGYSRSPLIECISDAYADTEHEGILISYQDSEKSKQGEMESEDLVGEDFDNVSEEGISHGAELVVQEQQQQDIISSMSETPSDDSLPRLNPNAQLTVLALKAQALVLSGSPQIVTGSSCEPHLGLQTAKDKQQNETRHLVNKNKDVTEWLLPPVQNFLYSQELEGQLGCEQEAAFKLGAHCQPTGVVDKPKSPSNLSEERDAESDTPKAFESVLMAGMQ